MRLSKLARLAAACATLLVIGIAGAPPAVAHTVDGAGPTNYLTELGDVEPDIRGVEVAVLEFGNRLEVRNTTDAELTVLGYHDEPFLRIGPDGVLQNMRSPATYLNADRQAKTTVPESADPEAEPEWQKVSDEPVARWHDHRVHWMGEEPPPAVDENPGEKFVIYEDWKVPMQLGDTELAANGTLTWVPGPSALPWFLIATALAVGIVLAVLTDRWRLVLAVGALALVVVSIVQAAGIAFAPSSTGTPLSRLASGGIYLVPAWLAGIFGARALLKGNNDGALGALLCGVILGFVGGIMDLGALFSSQVAFAGPPNSARLAIALCLGLAVGVVLGDVVAFAKHEAKPKLLPT